MPRTRTLAEMWTSVQLMADMPNTTFATATEGYERINYSIQKLWGEIVHSAGGDYFKAPRLWDTVANQSYTEIGSTDSGSTAPFLRLISLEVTLSGGVPQTIHELPNWEDRHELSRVSGWNGADGPYYSLAGSTTYPRVYWWPTPTAVHSVRAWIIPCAPRLTQTSDTFDGIDGFEDAVIHDAAIYLKQREESDPSLLMAERDRIMAHIKRVTGRNHASPRRVRDVRERGFFGSGRRRWENWR